jgi:hypothetical protein
MFSHPLAFNSVSGHGVDESTFRALADCRYVLADFSRYKTGQVGMRWRIEAEVIKGKGAILVS